MFLRIALVLPSLLALLPLSSAQSSTQKWSRLRMEVPWATNLATPVRAKAKTDILHLTIGLPLQDPIGLQHFVDAVSDPRSSDYRQFMTPEVVGQRFGLDPTNISKVTHYLASQGMTLKLVAKNRLTILADATVEQAEKAFNTSIVEYMVVDPISKTSARRYAFTSPPSIPPALKPFVKVVGGLENFLRPKPLSPLTFDQLRTLYNDAPLYQASFRGEGRTVAISNWDGYRLSNIALQYNKFSLPTPSGGIGSNVKVVSIDGQDGNTSTAQGEGDIDIQCVLGVAPLCNLVIYDNANQSDLLGVLTKEVNDNLADIISESYGWPTVGNNAYFEQVHTLHLSMSAQGITYLCASGDTGVAGIQTYPYPDEDPDVLVVGGTSVFTDNSGNRVSESVWNNSTGAAGGGYSQTSETFNALPTYQRGSGVPNNLPFRLSPDISLDADPETGYEIFIGDSLSLGWGGTSCASPTAAGSFALVEQQLIAKGALTANADGNRRLGRVNDLIYSFNGDSTVFFDVTTGNNGTLLNNIPSDATVGWDTASGWGAPNFNGFVNKVLNVPVPSSLILKPSTVIGGTSSVATLTLNQPAPAGGISISLRSSSVSASVPATVTIATGSNTATFNVRTVGLTNAESVTIKASAAGGSATAILTINPIAIISLAISQSPVVGGNQAQGTITLNGPAPAGGFDISLTSSDSAATVPLSVAVAGGSTTDTFTINTVGVSSQTTSTISGSDGTNTATGNLTIYPANLTSLSISPTSVAGGSTAIGTVTLSGNAPPTGLQISLSSGNSVAQVPANLTVPSGSSSATFSITTSPAQSYTPVIITASQGTTNVKAQITVGPIGLSSITLSPSTVIGGNSSVGTATISGPAPNGGLTINLTSSNPSAVVPGAVIIPAGALSATFQTTTTGVSVSVVATITGTQSTNTQSAQLTISPASLVSNNVIPSMVIGGSNALGTVTLSGTAGPGGTVVGLGSSSNNAIVATSVTVLSGQNSATYQISTLPVGSSTNSTLTATLGAVSQTATLAITPAAISSLVLNPNAVVGGLSSTGTVSLAGNAPSGGIVVHLSSNSAVVTSPQTVTISAGSSSANFVINTSPVLNDSAVTISATQGGTTLNAALTVQVPLLLNLMLNPNSVVGGNQTTGTITLARPATSEGAVVTLGSDSPCAITVASVSVPAGAMSATFEVQTVGVAATTGANISANIAGTIRSAPLSILPSTLGSLTVNPSTIVGGTSTTGTIQLSGTAPSIGTIVNLASNSLKAIVPSSVKIAAGSSTASFTIITKPTSKSDTLRIFAKNGDVAKTASLTLSPASLLGITTSSVSFVGGSSAVVMGTISLDGPAPNSGASVSLRSSNTSEIRVPALVRIMSGASSASFAITHSVVLSPQTVTVTANYNGTSVSISLTENPFQIENIFLTPTSVIGGTPSEGLVSLNAVVGHGSIVRVKFTSTSTAAIPPAIVQVQAGKATSKFIVVTKAVGAKTIAEITCTEGSSSSQADLTILPPSLKGFTVTPTTVKGSGNAIVTGNVTLSSPAPISGLTISLSNPNSNAVQLPTTVVIPGGKTSATFRISHSAVSSNQSVTLFASLNGVSLASTLNVTP